VKHQLFLLDELELGAMRPVQVDGLAVVVVRTLDGDLYAVRDRCPHAGAKLSNGRLERTVVGDGVGRYVLSDGHLIRCPWHGFEFDVSSGRCLADPENTRVRAYSVSVEGGVVWLEKPVRGTTVAGPG
jgi:nitrite reductase (NADH) small subunit